MEQKRLGGLDYFKLVAALLVVAIHTSPLSSISTNADFFFTRVLARIAVPFFLMVTGYFLLPQYLYEKSMDTRPLRQFLKKSFLLYMAAVILYFPVNIYAGHFYGAKFIDVFRMLVFDGTFYHLWYLPATILGVWIIWAGTHKLSHNVLAGICLALYVVGLLGDSYYGFITNSFIGGVFDHLFSVCSYTRNGLFYTPIFLVMGAWQSKFVKPAKTWVSFTGFSIFLFLMALEGALLHHLGVQRHDSMYVMLLPCMFFLFRLLTVWDRPPAKHLRRISTWIYLFHPLFIIIVRGIAKASHLEMILIDNSLIHYLAVCILSALAALFLEKLFHRTQKCEIHSGRAWIDLDKKNLYHNIDVLSELLPDGCQLMPAVKANAYGHGAVCIAKALQQKDIHAFCVASITEGIELRENGITGDILILGYTHPSQFSQLHKYRLIQTVVDYPYALSLNAYGIKLRVHLKIDTGMHRLGERPEQIDEIYQMFKMKNLEIDGIYTHLCVSDGVSRSDQEFTKEQACIFYGLLDKLDELGIDRPKIHLLASYGLINYPDIPGDYARIGIALYGLLSNRQDWKNCQVPLLPVLSLKARISLIKEVYKGEGAGYGLLYVAEQNRKIAVLAIGYADGIPRSLSCGVGNVLINGEFAPIIGNICMDQMLVDVTAISGVKQGDTAVIIGKSGDKEITAYDLAEQTGTITNELLSRLGSRLDRGLS